MTAAGRKHAQATGQGCRRSQRWPERSRARASSRASEVTPMGSPPTASSTPPSDEQGQRRQQIGPMDGPEVEHGDEQRTARTRAVPHSAAAAGPGATAPTTVSAGRTTPGDRPRIISGTASRAGRIRQGRRRAPRAAPHSPGAPSRRRAVRAGGPPRRRSIRPTASPAGSSPPRPEVSTRSPMAKPGLSGRKRSIGNGRVVALQESVVARALHDDRDARVEVGDQQGTGAARARRRSPGRPDPPGSLRTCPW